MPDKRYHWPIVGHEQIKKYLQSTIDKGKTSHAYLFHGPANVGKSLTADYFTLTLLCSGKAAKAIPCMKCSSCSQISKGVHPDVIEISRSQDKQHITIEQIREMNHRLSLRSFLNSYNIAIIRGAEYMTEESLNALLKTLEEPPKHTVFILITDHRHSLPQTVVSRCLAIDFQITPTVEIEKWLSSKGKSKSEARIISRYSNGRPGLAVQILDNHTMLDLHQEKIQQCLDIIKANSITKFDIIKNILQSIPASQQRSYCESLLTDWLNVIRDLFLLKNNFSYIINIRSQPTLQTLVTKFSNNRLKIIIENIKQSKISIKNSGNIQLILENLALELSP